MIESKMKPFRPPITTKAEMVVVSRDYYETEQLRLMIQLERIPGQPESCCMESRAYDSEHQRARAAEKLFRKAGRALRIRLTGETFFDRARRILTTLYWKARTFGRSEEFKHSDYADAYENED